MASSNYNPATGARISTDLYTFYSHVDGYTLNHTAQQILLNPPVVVNSITYTDVADIINELVSATNANSGQGFITIGDGYDTYHNQNGTVNFDPTIPSIDTILNPIFSAIYSNTALPASYKRIQHGGIVVIKAGTYIIRNTINVPPGIVIVGE